MYTTQMAMVQVVCLALIIVAFITFLKIIKETNNLVDKISELIKITSTVCENPDNVNVSLNTEFGGNDD
jgi:hypothetical protein